MKIFELVDLLQRKVNSILFRIVLLLYAGTILFFDQNSLPIIVYAVAIPLFLILYSVFGKFDKLRLTNDFVFIGVILLFKDPREVVNFIFLLLPIINSINFSGNQRSFLLYLYTVSIYACLFFFNKNTSQLPPIDVVLDIVVPVIFLWAVDYYTSLRSKVRLFREMLNDSVDEFYANKEYVKRPYLIYGELIGAINKKIKSDLIRDLYCFTSVKSTDKLIIIGGSNFLWKFEVKSDFLSRIRDKKILLNEVVVLGHHVQSFNLAMYTNIYNQEYIFLFTTKGAIPFYYWIIGFFRILEPALFKLSKIFLMERRLQELRAEEISKLTEKSQYVNRANKTMHFVRNRLGPFSNLISMLDSAENVEESKAGQFEKLLATETGRAKVELRNITSRADAMLEKSKNPFIYTIVQNYSLEVFFTRLRSNFLFYFPDEDIVVEKFPSTKVFVALNEEGFEVFLSDWLNNMKKYRASFARCDFLVEEEFVSIKFVNDHDQEHSEIDKMIEDLDSKGRNEIMKRTTHGLFFIKNILEDMGISFKLNHLAEMNQIEFVLLIKIYSNENSSF